MTLILQIGKLQFREFKLKYKYITQDKNKGVFKNGPESSPDDCSVYTHKAVCDIVTGMMHAKARAITSHQGLVKSFLDGIGKY